MKLMNMIVRVKEKRWGSFFSFDALSVKIYFICFICHILFLSSLLLQIFHWKRDTSRAWKSVFLNNPLPFSVRTWTEDPGLSTKAVTPFCSDHMKNDSIFEIWWLVNHQRNSIFFQILSQHFLLFPFGNSFWYPKYYYLFFQLSLVSYLVRRHDDKYLIYL